MEDWQPDSAKESKAGLAADDDSSFIVSKQLLLLRHTAA